MNRLRREHRTSLAVAPREIESVNRRSKEILELLLKGFRDERWKEELHAIEQRRTELEAIIASAGTEPVLPALHPRMAEIFRQKAIQLASALADETDAHRETTRQSLRGF